MMLKWCMILLVLCTITVADSARSCEKLDPADDPRYIVRPCPNFDLDCIRNYFAGHSNCEKVEGPIQDPPNIDEYTIKYPNSNITLVMRDVAVKGLYGEIVEFYLNMATNKVVLAMRTSNLQLESPNGTMDFHRKGKESISRSDFVTYGYGDATLTSEWSELNNMNLNDMKVSSYIEQKSPPYTVGPNFRRTSDLVAIREFREYAGDVSLAVRVESTWHESILMTLYIQNAICNFNDDNLCSQ